MPHAAPRGRRIAIVDGVRTPFARRGGALAALGAVDLGAAAVRALIARGAPVAALERIVFGQVVPSMTAPNLAREVALDAGLPGDLDATSVSRACTTGHRAVIDLAHAIAAGDVRGGLAGGADSLSDVPVAVSRPLADAVLAQRTARGLRARLAPLARLGPRDLIPAPPAIAERSTGRSMGEHAERLARVHGIERAAQDAFAHRSHARAAAAWDDGRLAGEVVAVAGVARDGLVRRRADPAAYARLPPAFAEDGTITSGNSSALTDGASAVVVVREDVARAEGLAPLAFVRAAAFTALDPRAEPEQLLMGPAYAIPRALDRAGVAWRDLALVDLHEAFAAQVLAVVAALGSPAWAARHLGRGAAVGEVDPDRLNVTGGSIAIGHPFAATGGRQLVQTARELARRGGGLACVAACAAGGLGAAIVLEVEA